MLVAIAVGAAATAGPPARADHSGLPEPPGWTALLPGLDTTQRPQPGALRHCRRLRVACVDRVARRLAAMRDAWGCDHRAVFASTYWWVTTEAASVLRDEPGIFRSPRWIVAQDVLFADFYVRTQRAWAAGRAVPEAWRVALDAAAHGDRNAGQDLLLGINAHVQRDQPFVLASIGLWTRLGESRKPDHEAFNKVLSLSYDPIVEEIGRRYDPMMKVADGGPSPVDDWAGLELVRDWREGVWRNAERLLNARDATERRQVADSIEANAAAWAGSIAAGEMPGYRAQRDAYCRAARG